MADLKISQLNALAGASLASTDELAVVDGSASETKKITSVDLVRYGYGLISASTLDGDIIEPGTTSARGTVQLTDSTSSTSTTTAATPNAVKTSFDLATAALPKSGGTMTGAILADDSTSASTPGYAFDGDPNTGLLRTGADELALVTGGTARLTADASGNVVIPGNLTVQGTTTTIDSTTLIVEDKNIEMGAVATPTDVTADGGGITLKGTTDKTINWIDATDAWTFSEHVNINTGKEYRIAGTKVLDSTSLGSGVVSSSLTSLGTVTTGTWSASTIAANKGGTGQTTYTDGQLLIGKTDGTLAKATLTASTGVTITNGDGTITISATGSGGTVTGVTATSPLASTGGTAPVISIQDGTTSQKGAVQLEDSTSSTSTTKAATPNSVKSAYDLANAALPKAGGTLTGDVTFNAQSDLRFADSDSSNWVAFQGAATIASNVTWTLPSADGTSGQVLSTNGSGTLSWASAATGDVTLAGNNAFTGANTFTNTTGQIFRPAATQDGVLIRGRAGGTSSYTAEVVPTTLTASRTITLPDATGTVALLGTAQTFTAAQTFNSGASDAAGSFRVIPQNSQTTGYTLVASDTGKHISITTGGVTVPASVFSAGDVVSIYNNSGSNQTITQGASTTLRQAGTATTGNRTLAQYGVATVLCVASNTFVISGAGLT